MPPHRLSIKIPVILLKRLFNALISSSSEREEAASTQGTNFTDQTESYHDAFVNTKAQRILGRSQFTVACGLLGLPFALSFSHLQRTIPGIRKACSLSHRHLRETRLALL